MDLRGGSRLAVGTERQGGMKCTHGDHRKGQVERLEEEQNSEREMGHKFLQGESKKPGIRAIYCPCIPVRQSGQPAVYEKHRVRTVAKQNCREARALARSVSELPPPERRPPGNTQQ